MSENKMVYFLMILAAFIWGGTFNAAGFALNGFHPLSVAFIRFALATVVLLIAGHREIFGTPVTGRTGPILFCSTYRHFRLQCFFHVRDEVYFAR